MKDILFNVTDIRIEISFKSFDELRILYLFISEIIFIKLMYPVKIL